MISRCWSLVAHSALNCDFQQMLQFLYMQYQNNSNYTLHFLLKSKFNSYKQAWLKEKIEEIHHGMKYKKALFHYPWQ